MTRVNATRIFVSLGVLTALTTTMGARADKYDTIEQKQDLMKQRINTELSSSDISEKDSKELHKMMQDVDQHRRKLKSLHNDILTTDDDEALDKELNSIGARIESMKLYRRASKK